jgi:hypothetical protein
VFSLVLCNGGKLESYLPELLDSKIEGGHLANYFVPQKPEFPVSGARTVMSGLQHQGDGSAVLHPNRPWKNVGVGRRCSTNPAGQYSLIAM